MFLINIIKKVIFIVSGFAVMQFGICSEDYLQLAKNIHGDDYYSQSERIRLLNLATDSRLPQGSNYEEAAFLLSKAYDNGEYSDSIVPTEYAQRSLSLLEKLVFRSDSIVKTIRDDFSSEIIKIQSLYSLARKYYYGIGTKQDFRKACYLIHELYGILRDNDNRIFVEEELKYNVAYLTYRTFILGHGIDRSTDNALFTLECIQESWHDYSGKCLIANCYELSENFEEAFRYYQESSASYSRAKCFLGFCYQNSLGIAESKFQAEIYYREGITSEDPKTKAISCCLLARLIELTRGSNEEIYQLYGMAAECGIISEVDFYMGWILEHGLFGQRKNLDEAKTWYEKAVRKGFPGAYFSLAELTSNEALYKISEDLEVIRALYRKSKQIGSDKGLFQECHRKILNKRQTDLTEPYFDWMDKNNQLTEIEQSEVKVCFESDYTISPESLLKIFNEKITEEKLLIKSEKLSEDEKRIRFGLLENDFESLCEHGSSDAICHLGLWYLKGNLAVQADIKKAIQYLKEAAEKNHVEAFYQLGLLYESGKGMEHKDLEQAKICFRRAADGGHSYAKGALNRLESSSGCVVM